MNGHNVSSEILFLPLSASPKADSLAHHDDLLAQHYHIITPVLAVV